MATTWTDKPKQSTSWTDKAEPNTYSIYLMMQNGDNIKLQDGSLLIAGTVVGLEFTDKAKQSTSYTDKAKQSTSWTDKAKPSTSWTDKEKP